MTVQEREGEEGTEGFVRAERVKGKGERENGLKND